MKELIRVFHRAGIDTAMITGDQSPTAYAIGKELDTGSSPVQALSQGEPLEVLDSTHLAQIDPQVMQALFEKVQSLPRTRSGVFARVSPAHKLQIVQALQRAGRVVAMTGGLGQPLNTMQLLWIKMNGPFIVGGPSAHSGLTGRKNAIDTYGEYARHSGLP